MFYNDYSGLQLPFDVNQNPSAPATVIRNAERASTYGAEIGVRFRALSSLNVWGSAGALKTQVDRYGDPSIQGNELPRAPAFSASLGIAATFFTNLEVSFDTRYADAYFSDVFNNARGRTDPYTLVNAQVAYTYANARFTFAATNLFDSDKYLTRTPGATPAADIATLTEPRRLTVGVEMQF